uniref:Gustatory receptor n=1 Tax=Daphnia galeata TaxID=27404 RepID=A0A8J2RB23_9CRUS|nr:unnamed protein product [Daphnia galeata]
MVTKVGGIEMLSRLRNQRIRKANGLVTNITLDETLRPLWKLTYYCGILLDWCLPISKNSFRIFKAVRYVLITFLFSLLLAVTSFELIQLLLETGKASNIHAIIPHFLWFVPLLLAVVIHLHSLRRRKEFLNFFKDWRQLEIEIAHLNPNCIMCKSKKMHLRMYAIYVIITLASVLSLGLDIFNNPEAPYLLSTYPAVRQVIPLLVIGSVHLVSIILIWILTAMGDFIPSFTYYHAALAVSCLENDVKALFDKHKDADEFCIRSRLSLLADKLNTDPLMKKLPSIESLILCELDIPIRRVWTRYENVGKMVSRADYLFGSFLVYGQVGNVFCMTMLVYSVLYNLGDALKMRTVGPILSYILILTAVVFRFSSSVIISSQLHRSVSQFRTALNDLMSKHWNRITKGDRDLLRSFMWRIQSDPLVASPLGVYKVTPSVLLSVLSVVVSYVIVLLQSK